MKTIIAASLIVPLMLTAASAQTVEQRAPNGNLLGTLKQEGSRQVERDPSGRALSYYTRQGDRIEHRSMDGRLLDTAKTR